MLLLQLFKGKQNFIVMLHVNVQCYSNILILEYQNILFSFNLKQNQIILHNKWEYITLNEAGKMNGRTELKQIDLKSKSAVFWNLMHEWWLGSANLFLLLSNCSLCNIMIRLHFRKFHHIRLMSKILCLETQFGGNYFCFIEQIQREKINVKCFDKSFLIISIRALHLLQALFLT